MTATSRLVSGWAILAGLLGCSPGEDGGSSVDVQQDVPAADPRDFATLNFEVIEIVRGGCGSGAAACHGSSPTERPLNFAPLLDSGTLWEAMADVPSCQYDAMPLVAPGDPDRSWLMVKLTAKAGTDGGIVFEPDPAWEPSPESCVVEVNGVYDFGSRMPEIGVLSESDIATIRAWILAGPKKNGQ
jgi:hypothetical protein